MAGLRLHILQWRLVIQCLGDMCTPQIMRGQVTNTGAGAATGSG